MSPCLFCQFSTYFLPPKSPNLYFRGVVCMPAPDHGAAEVVADIVGPPDPDPCTRTRPTVRRARAVRVDNYITLDIKIGNIIILALLLLNYSNFFFFRLISSPSEDLIKIVHIVSVTRSILSHSKGKDPYIFGSRSLEWSGGFIFILSPLSPPPPHPTLDTGH